MSGNNVARKIVCLLGGATGSGKTEVGIALAQAKGWEILSCDGGQARKGMEVGTAAPTQEQCARVPHHLVGYLDPRVGDSVADFWDRVHALLQTPGPDLVAVGGTGQYLSALREGLDAVPPPDPQLRAQLQSRWERGEADALLRELHESGDAIPHDVQNPVRLIRALEKAIQRQRGLTGVARSPLAAQCPAFALLWPREILHERLAQRLEIMLKQGWKAEADALKSLGYGLDAPGMRAIGYRELGALPEAAGVDKETREQILAQTRQYARRQETWLRTRLAPTWLDAQLPVQVLVTQMLESLDNT